MRLIVDTGLHYRGMNRWVLISRNTPLHYVVTLSFYLYPYPESVVGNVYSAIYWSQLFRPGLALTLGENLTHCFSLCVSMHPFLLKLKKRKLQSILARFMKKYFQVYEKGLGKFALNFELTQGFKLICFLTTGPWIVFSQTF